MKRFSISLAVVLTLAIGVTAQPSQSKKTLKLIGTTRIGHSKTAPSEVGSEYMTGPEVDVSTTKPQISGTTSPARVPSAHVPNPTGNALITAGGSNAASFNGITHRDQRLASNGNQFSVEPPDQGLAVSNSFVVEAVNDAVAVYSTSGTLLSGPTSLNDFWVCLPPLIAPKIHSCSALIQPIREYISIAPPGDSFWSLWCLAWIKTKTSCLRPSSTLQ